MGNKVDLDSTPNDADAQALYLVDQLAKAIAERIAAPLPLSIQLWNAKAIGTYLQRSPAVVLERVVTLSDFPAPIRLPSTRSKAKADESRPQRNATGQPLWKAIEVIRWTESHQNIRRAQARDANKKVPPILTPDK
ncbi:hypothetical protein PPN31114_00273 [Pandoraea pneumonica]|jgi:hypothetical protein|uniref:Uncharacterized protein n=1 Tax=Pandoraea pneumonica TaxID=2508299 RepID=A0A5E4RN77_9BURK|nr:hypothetical protein [Pandoraea pneumonica]VVD64445.1 hypothetical protein PPN31114_00273 [Pandoraea pneumonica]